MAPQRPVCVVMAVHRPDINFLKVQLESIASQTHPLTWLVLVCADGESLVVARREVERAGFGGATVQILEPAEKLDVVRAFEAGLNVALDLTEDVPNAYVALSDQDDIWHPDRLKYAVGALDAEPDVMLVHSDSRLVDEQGEVLHASMFQFEKRHRKPGLRGLLYRNNVTGMTATMRRQVVELAMPIAPQSGVHFYHDLWLALIAGTLGKIELIDEPLVDYRQHGENVIGAIDRETEKNAVQRFIGLFKQTRTSLNARVRREASSYALARYLARSVHARIARSVEAGDLPRDETNTRPLLPYLRGRGIGLVHVSDAAWLLLQGKLGLARIALGQGVIAAGRVVWALRKAFGVGLQEKLGDFDKRLFEMSPGVEPPKIEPVDVRPAHVATLIDSRKWAKWTPRFDAPQPSLTLLLPSLNPTEAFAGIATAIDIGVGLAARGHRVRFVATDLPIASMDTSRRFVLSRMGNAAKEAGAEELITLACGVMGDGTTDVPSISSHLDDVFLASAWWTAHVAKQLMTKFGYRQSKFVYLIQDFEPNFYPWGAEFADAMASYDMDVLAVFNTTLLRDHFAAEGFRFASAPDALAFRPSIDLSVYSGQRPAAQGRPRKLVIYGRSEVARNMFSTTLEGIDLFLKAESLKPQDIIMESVGLSHRAVNFDGGHVLNSLGKLPFESYPSFLLSVDLGVSLMYSPHPSHPPLEMAASGVRVVTNTFGPKDLSNLSPLIQSASATPQAVARALSKHWHAGDIGLNDREVDLVPLGQSIEDMVAQLSGEVVALGVTKKDDI